MSFKRHLVTAFLLGPLLAQLVGRWMGWLESNGYGSVSAKASACWEQIGLRDLDVIQKSVWCQEEYGMMGREEAKRVIGGRRGRGMYIEDLAGACIQLDLEFGGVCRVVGEVDEEWDVDRVENEGRNRYVFLFFSVIRFFGGVFGERERLLRIGLIVMMTDFRHSERAHMRWIFEECHARFGVEMQMIWKKGVRSLFSSSLLFPSSPPAPHPFTLDKSDCVDDIL